MKRVAADIDLSDVDLFAGGPPWWAFDRLRREAPVHWNPEVPPNHGFWAVTRHADVLAVDRDAKRFSSERGAVALEELDDRQLELRKSMIDTDPPRHTALRRLLQGDFTPRSLASFESFLRALTVTTLEEALAKRELDFVPDVSADFPIQVLARLLGVPEEDTDRLVAWGNQMFGNTDPDYTAVLADSPESERYRDLPFRSPAALELFRYGRELAVRRRGRAGGDLVSKLVNELPHDGVPLSDVELDNNFQLLVVAGNETTRHAISHTLLALIEHPEQFELLREQPELIGPAVEEFLRWATPIYQFRRTATCDTELGGVELGEGDKVVMWFASANRDEEAFAEPYRFDVARRPNEHVTFGRGGPHLCLGASLARLELRVMFEELLQRVRRVELAGEVRRVRSNFINGIKAMPVRVTLE
ncbi:MAG: cytochrome P450 [Acidimicrobiales bacterium]